MDTDVRILTTGSIAMVRIAGRVAGAAAVVATVQKPQGKKPQRRYRVAGNWPRSNQESGYSQRR